MVLMMQKSLAPLPALSIAEDAAFDSDFMEPVRALSEEVSNRHQANGSHPDSSSSYSGDCRRGSPPQPVDLLVPPHTSVVVVTGPNTGGLTHP